MRIILLIIFCSVFISCPLSGARKRTNKLSVATTSQESEDYVDDYGLYDAIFDGDVEEVKQILEEHLSDLGKEAINQAFLQTVTGRKKNLRQKIAVLFLEYSEVRAALSGPVLDNAVIKCIQERQTDLYFKILCSKTLRKKLYVSQETKDRFEKAFRYLTKKWRKKYLKEFLSYADLRAKLPQELKNVFLRYLTNVKKLTPQAKQMITACLDDFEFRNAIQNQTFEDILEFANEIFKGEHQGAKNAADCVLDMFCRHEYLEHKIYEICQAKGYAAVLENFEDERTFMSAFQIKDVEFMRKILERNRCVLDNVEVHFIFIIAFYQRFREGIAILLSCKEFREKLFGESFSLVLSVLNNCLVGKNKHNQAMAKFVLDQMCEYKDLKKRVLEYVRENGYESLAKYLET